MTSPFKHNRIFLPVIHPVSRYIALNSIQVAVDSGADGIFLIDQGMSSDELLEFIPEVYSQFPGLWIGVNLLDTSPNLVIDRIKALPIQGIWSDRAGIDEYGDTHEAQKFLVAREVNSWTGLYFGGVAFKYQRPVLNDMLATAAEKAVPYMDFITTSGISPDNVEQFLPYVDAYLVATGIETAKYSGILIPEKTAELARKIHSFNELN